MISLTRDELLSRFRNWTQTKSTAPGHFDDTRAIELLNDGQYEVYRRLVDTFQEIYFVALQENISPVNGEINLDTLDKPFYRAIDLQKYDGVKWVSVNIAGVRQGRRSSAWYQERWFPIGRKLKTDNTSVVGPYRLGYHYLIPKLTQGGQMTEIPMEYAEIVPLEANRLGMLQQRRKEDVQFFEMECQKRYEEMKRSASNRIMSMQHSIVDVESGNGSINLIDGVYIIS